MPASRLRVAALLPALLLAALFLTSLRPHPPDEPAPPRAAAAGDVLTDAMNRMESAMRNLRRAVRSAEQRAPALGELEILQRAVLDAKLQVPPIARELEGAAREELLLAYRRSLADFLRRAVELELAVIDGDVERAAKLWGELSELEDAGHERFAPGG